MLPRGRGVKKRLQGFSRNTSLGSRGRKPPVRGRGRGSRVSSAGCAALSISQSSVQVVQPVAVEDVKPSPPPPFMRRAGRGRSRGRGRAPQATFGGEQAGDFQRARGYSKDELSVGSPRAFSRDDKLTCLSKSTRDDQWPPTVLSPDDPITLPLSPTREAELANPQALVEGFERLDVVKGIFGPDSDKTFSIVQLPSVLPHATYSKAIRSQEQNAHVDEKRAMVEDSSFRPLFESLEPGKCGKLKIYKSGKMMLHLGQSVLQLNRGVPSSHHQEVCVLNCEREDDAEAPTAGPDVKPDMKSDATAQSGKKHEYCPPPMLPGLHPQSMILLGRVSNKIVCTPHIESLLPLWWEGMADGSLAMLDEDSSDALEESDSGEESD